MATAIDQPPVNAPEQSLRAVTNEASPTNAASGGIVFGLALSLPLWALIGFAISLLWGPSSRDGLTDRPVGGAGTAESTRLHARPLNAEAGITD